MTGNSNSSSLTKLVYSNNLNNYRLVDNNCVQAAPCLLEICIYTFALIVQTRPLFTQTVICVCGTTQCVLCKMLYHRFWLHIQKHCDATSNSYQNKVNIQFFIEFKKCFIVCIGILSLRDGQYVILLSPKITIMTRYL